MACGAAALGALAAAGLLSVGDARAHKPVTTRFTFGRDVAPILRTRCAPCHREGGPGPMPLDTHAAARPWAQAIAERVLEGTMPPWFAEPDGEPIRGDRGLTAKEIDILAAWALGGAPPGEAGPSPPAGPEASSSPPAPGQGIIVEAIPLGDVSLAAGESRAELEASGPPLDRDRWLAAWWVESGRPDLVRAATLAFMGDGESSVPAGGWVQGFGEAMFPDGAGLRIPAGSKPSLRLHAGRGLGSERGSARFGIVLHLAFHRERPALGLSPIRLERHFAMGNAATVIAACATFGPGRLEVVESSARSRILLSTRDGGAAWPLLLAFETPVRIGPGRILQWSPYPGAAESPAAAIFVIPESAPGPPPRGAPPRRR